MDTNKIVKEWFYRLPKGYALAPYTNQELKVLKEVLDENEMSIEEVDILDQGFLDAEPVDTKKKTHTLKELHKLKDNIILIKNLINLIRLQRI